MYRVRICDPAAFGATTQGGATWDTQLFLFRADGMGVSFNDDASEVPIVRQSTLTSAFTSGLPAGEFYLAVSGYDLDPTGAGQEIWLDTSFYIERQPDGPGAGFPVDGWTSTGASGAYTIALNGTCYAESGVQCYANCDSSTTIPVLNVGDFTCFLQRYANNDPYANCDNSTAIPVLNVGDFTCFLQSYAGGCR
jgi:hypothetical protein